MYLPGGLPNSAGRHPEMVKAEIDHLLFHLRDYEVEILQTSPASNRFG
jgi:hypothetical protein